MKSNPRAAGAERRRFEPTAEWVAAFERQYDDALARFAERYAARLLAGPGQSIASGDPEARELAANSFGDTLEGVARWDPGTTTLSDHIKAVIRKRAAARRRRARKFPHHSLDDDEATALRGEAERALREQRPDPHASERAAAAIDAMRLLAERDPKLALYIEARARGITRASLMHRTGLSIAEYRSVRRRLRRLMGNHVSLPRKRAQNED